MRGGCVLLLCTAFAVSVAGCSLATASENASGGDLTGVWIGDLTVDHVHGQRGCPPRHQFRSPSAAIRDQWLSPMLVG